MSDDRPLEEWAEELRRRQALLEEREKALAQRRAELEEWRRRLLQRERALRARSGRPRAEGPHPYFRASRRRGPLGLPAELSASYAIIGINVAVFLLDMLLGGRILVAAGGKWAPAIWAGQHYRLLTAVFLHWDVLHLLMNSYAIYLLGPLLERSLGTARFLVLYILAGLSGSAASVIFYPGTFSVGASGAVFGLFGYLLFTRWRSPFTIPPALNQWITSILVLNLVITFLPGTRIDVGGHLGGLAGGFVSGFVVGLPGQRSWPLLEGGRHAAAAIVALVALIGFIGMSTSP